MPFPFRRACAWAATIATLFVAGAYALSLTHVMGWHGPSVAWWLGGGALEFMWCESGAAWMEGHPLDNGWDWESGFTSSVRWWVATDNLDLSYSKMIILPLWMPLIAAGGLAAVLWRWARSSHKGFCGRCRYSLSGLSSVGRCPECGCPQQESPGV